METAIVTAIGSFSSDIVIRTLKEEGFYVIGCDIYDRKWVAQSLDTDEFYQAPYAADEEVYMEFLKQLCRDKKPKLLLPLTDVEVDVLNIHREELEMLHTMVCMSERKTISLCRNKEKLEKYVREAGICRTIPSIPMRELLKAAEGEKEDKSGVEKESEGNSLLTMIPWKQMVLKPINGRSSSGLYRVYDKRKLPAYKRLVDRPEEYLIQPLIDGDVITVDVVRDNKGNMVAVPRRELLRTLNGAGTSVEVFRDRALEECCMRIAALLDIRGCVNFEFIEEKGTGEQYFMECNPRFSGGAAFSCLAGCDVVRKHIQVFQGNSISSENRAVCCHIARKYKESIVE
ncbi:ATP-grasp domain-containing protein [Lachnospiraceae bacterium 62-35]